MPPKAAKNTEVPTTLEDLVATVKALTVSSEAMREQLASSTTTINGLSTRLTTIETLLKVTQAENVTLKEELQGSYSEVSNLKNKLNNLEQYQRSWSIRVAGLAIPTADENDSNKVKHHLYEKFLKPILAGAVQQMILPSLPLCDEILERAHILPAKDNAVKSIIARFYCRDMRALCFMLRKEFAPKEAVTRAATRTSGALDTSRPKYLYQMYDDLTRTNFLKMKAIGDDKRVHQCWATNGQLKFRLVDSEQVRKVHNVFDTIDQILS